MLTNVVNPVTNVNSGDVADTPSDRVPMSLQHDDHPQKIIETPPQGVPDIDAPDFQLACFPGDPTDGGDRGDCDMIVSLQGPPDIKKHASMALLVGLAILVLDQQGTLNDTVQAMLAEGPISEVDAHNRITLLLQEEQNVQPV
ncbi:hypothetical protein BAJUN_02960 [Bajunvirus bajun]|uniref:Uncharacterized protein n=1 Tax=Brevundimonas phage vB_BgoS-Bajun TaxID=2948594 RepID=A0A9E7SUY6_9CAUD|nr:hypothetical protein BAJUN_02960 [Brevundimonas phage vB_BgoS-Bajun]